MSEPEQAKETSGAYGGPEAEWSPVPTAEIKAWLKKNPDANMESVFPTVYEEDRTAKIKDLATAQGLGYITHQRSAEQSVKELGFENYNYQEEQAQIRTESKLVSPTELGVADGIARSVVGLPGAGPNGAQPRGGGAGDPTAHAIPVGGVGDEPEPQMKRQDLSGPAQHEFRKAQKESVDLVGEVAETIRTLRESMIEERDRTAADTQTLRESVTRDTQAIVQRFTEVLAQIVEKISAPIVHVHVPEPKPRMIKLTRDARGLMMTMEESAAPERPTKVREKSKEKPR